VNSIWSPEFTGRPPLAICLPLSNEAGFMLRVTYKHPDSILPVRR